MVPSWASVSRYCVLGENMMSGELPAVAALAKSESLLLPVRCTVSHGYLACSLSRAAWSASSWFCLCENVHISSVTGACAFEVSTLLTFWDDFDPVDVHAATAGRTTASATPAGHRRLAPRRAIRFFPFRLDIWYIRPPPCSDAVMALCRRNLAHPGPSLDSADVMH